MLGLTAEQIGQKLLELGLADDRQLQDAWATFGRKQATGDEFLQSLLRRSVITNFQAERVLKGERFGYFYGDYKVLYLVASGSFARVYRAVKRDGDEVVALKVLRKRYCDDADQTSQFFHEGQVGLKLRHPNIVPIYEVFSKDLTHYLVMEFIEGRNLREFLKVRQKVEPIEATKLLIDVVRGLDYASQHGVTHRDMKMSNILISSKGDAKLVDFGLAAEGVEVKGHANPRTIDYAGLERISGVRNNDPRSDLYFVGCIYYHMLTGTPPLVETKERSIRLSRQRFTNVVPIHVFAPHVPRVVAAVINKAMSLDPERRYQNPGEMLADLTLTKERLETGQELDSVSGLHAESTEGDAKAGELKSPALMANDANRPAVMCVESNPELQDILRTGLKRSGYRVMVTNDPDHPASRFYLKRDTAQCVIFSVASLGNEALEAFNRFAGDEDTKTVPAILLLSEGQEELADQAKLADHRRVLMLPLKLKNLRKTLNDLVPLEQGSQPSP